MPADPGPENSVTGNDERHAEIEALSDVFLSHVDFRGDRAFATLLAERCMRRLDRVRRAPGPSSRERDTGTGVERRDIMDVFRSDEAMQAFGVERPRPPQNDEHETENEG